MIVYTFDPQGGFVAGDTATGLTSYAYPTSSAAVAAKRNASKVAAEMVASEIAWLRDDTAPAGALCREYDARMWATLRVRGALVGA